jgi:MFS superfamily sulfate permease-like transporter
MASAVLVGVNPVYGLYASMAGPIGGGVAVGTKLMVVTTTTAAALAAGSALSGFSGGQRSEALFVLTALAGSMMVAAGLLRLGRYTRFVSVSALTGFLTGVAVNIILGQLADLLGSPQNGSSRGSAAAVPGLKVAVVHLVHPSRLAQSRADSNIGSQRRATGRLLILSTGLPRTYVYQPGPSQPSTR